MQPTVEHVDGVAVVSVHLDELDISSVDDFNHDIAVIMEENKKLVLDMSRVQFIDSSGCGAIIACLKRLADAGGDLKLCGVNKAVATVLQLIRLHRICDILESREEAVQAFKR